MVLAIFSSVAFYFAQGTVDDDFVWIHALLTLECGLAASLAYVLMPCLCRAKSHNEFARAQILVAGYVCLHIWLHAGVWIPWIVGQALHSNLFDVLVVSNVRSVVSLLWKAGVTVVNELRS